jgi:hypothetical protein
MPNRDFPPLKTWSVAKGIVALLRRFRVSVTKHTARFMLSLLITKKNWRRQCAELLCLRVRAARQLRARYTSGKTQAIFGYGAVSCSTSTSPGRRTRVRPCVAMRRICAGVSVGNTCSTRVLLSGSPRLTWLIVVFGGAAALPDYLSLFCRDRCGEPRSQVEVHLTYRSIPMRSTPSTCLI